MENIARILKAKEIKIKKQFIAPLTSVRIIAAIVIYIHHFTYNPDFSIPFGPMLNWRMFRLLIANAAHALDLFLLLSGFLMLYVYREKFKNGITFKNVKYYYLLRLSRIYPLHILTIFIVWLLFIANLCEPSGINLTGSFFLNATLMSSWGVNEVITWNSPAWALSAEWFCYLLFPLLGLFFSNIDNKLYLLSIFLFFTFAYLVFLKNIAPIPMPSSFDYSTYFPLNPPFFGAGSLIRTFFCFSTGCILYKLFEQNFLKKLNWDIIFIIVSIILFCKFTYDINSKYKILEVFFLLNILLYSLANCKKKIYSIFSNKVFVYLGKIAFALYMLHYPYLKIVNYMYTKFNISVNSPWVNFLIVTIILLILSSFFYHFVEVRCQELLRRKFIKDPGEI